MIFGGPDAVKSDYANLKRRLAQDAKDRRIKELEGFIDAYCGQPDQTKVFDEFKAIRDKNTELESVLAKIARMCANCANPYRTLWDSIGYGRFRGMR